MKILSSTRWILYCLARADEHHAMAESFRYATTAARLDAHSTPEHRKSMILHSRKLRASYMRNKRAMLRLMRDEMESSRGHFESLGGIRAMNAMLAQLRN